MANQYYFHDVDQQTRNATQKIIAWLEAKGFVVKDVQKNWCYQQMDIDLIAFKDGRIHWIEIKVDSYYKTGNYFLEFLSNEEKGTEGCFLSTKSHYIFYYFEGADELHIMDTQESQQWFRANIDRFKDRRVSTGNKNGTKLWYHTVGKLVSRKIMQKEVEIKIHKL